MRRDKQKAHLAACSNESQSNFIIIRCVRRQNHRQTQSLCRSFYTLPPWTLPLLEPAEACYTACARQHLFEQLKALGIDLRIEQTDISGDISARFCQTADDS